MPLQVCPHPIDFPGSRRLYVGRFCEGVLNDLVGATERRPNLKKLDTLIYDPISDIQLRANLRGRAARLNVSSYRLLESVSLNFGKRHN